MVTYKRLLLGFAVLVQLLLLVEEVDHRISNCLRTLLLISLSIVSVSMPNAQQRHKILRTLHSHSHPCFGRLLGWQTCLLRTHARLLPKKWLMFICIRSSVSFAWLFAGRQGDKENYRTRREWPDWANSHNVFLLHCSGKFYVPSAER